MCIDTIPGNIGLIHKSTCLDSSMSRLHSLLGYSAGDPGFATDCPWGAWCRELTTSLQYVGPLFGNLV